MKKIYLLSLFMGFSIVGIAQESSCTDGIDNDGDGFIDCFDGDCAGNTSCEGFYTGNDKDCQLPQPPGSEFRMTLKTKTAQDVTTTHGTFRIGDMGHPVNGKDGIPEVVTAHAGTKKLYILDGKTLAIKYQATTQYKIERYDITIGDVKNNGCAHVFIAEVNGSRHYISSYDCAAQLVWRREVYGRPFTMALADFDHDGKTELYYRNEILDAATGERLVAGSGDWYKIDGGPVAVDILEDAECAQCPGLELVLGGQIYAVNLNPRIADGGTLTLEREFNNLPNLDPPGPGNTVKYFPKYLDLGGDKFVNSQTSIADFDLDGYLDVLMTGSSYASETSATTVFYWNVKKQEYKVYQPKQANGSSWKYGAGRLNIADVDGDGKMNVAFVSGSRLYVLDENLGLKWFKQISEVSSGYTSTTVFDFNNDKAAEIVYRDENFLYIFNGKTAAASPAIDCKSLTSNDYPIVADVDADGSTEICVVCLSDDNKNIYWYPNDGEIRTYKSALEPWVSARKVWNQHAYFNVNVNDDLTIPKVQQKHHLVFSVNECGVSSGENRALNSFLNQSAILDSDGCKTYAAADVAFLAKNGSLLNITPPTCPDVDFTVSFSLKNIGDLDLTGDFPITFYSGDPSLAGAVKLGTEIIPLNDFKIGDSLDMPNMVVPGTGGAFTLFAVLNDAGTTVPTPISLPNSDFVECNYTNNIVSASVDPQVFQLTTASTDHVQCGSGASAPNGSVEAFKLEGATKQTVGYTFYWFDGTTAGAPDSADYTGPVRTGLMDGTYTVYATHDAYQCGSDTVQVNVALQTRTISATVTVDKPFKNCKNPDGKLTVTPDGGQPLGNYDYEWFEGTVFGTSPILSNSHVLTSTQALTYSVLVTEKSSNCETLESGTVPDLTVTPVVTTASIPANCAPPNSGQASADVGGATAGYTFYWYDGSTSKPAEDFLGDTYANVTAGNYTVIAKDNTTGCSSNETVVVVASVAGITVSANITAQQTSCASPNGAASANVGGTTAGYTFRWFRGNNTLPANEVGTNAVISGLAAGDYTVQATSTTTGCTDTELITIVDDIKIPTVSASVIANQVDCFPPDGAVNATAAGSPGPYTFYWFNGNIGTPDTTAANFKGADYTGLTGGFYTVVAVDINSRCASARGLVEVLDQTVNPVITTSAVNQTSCDAANPNGQASANVGGVTAGYKFRWFTGSDTTTFIMESPSLTNRAAGTYTVKAVNRATGCFTTKLVVLNDVSAKPTLSLVATDNSVCSSTIGFTGSVTSSFLTNPNVQPGHIFVYEWRKNSVVIAGQSGSSISGLNAGMYSVTVTNQNLACTSDAVSIEVKDVVELPVITTSLIASTNCTGLPNGSVTVTAPAAGAEYRWYAGTVAGVGAMLNSAITNPTATGLQGGAGQNYIVEVTLTATGCKNTATVLLPDNSELPVLGPLSKVDNTLCVGSNGEAIIGTVSYQAGAVTIPDPDYTLLWSNGGTTSAITGLAAATYSLTVTKTDVGCTSAPVSIEVEDNLTLPVISTATSASTNCAGGLLNGSATVTGVVPGGPYEYRWYSGSVVGAAGTEINSGISDLDINGRQGSASAFHTVEVTIQATGCKNSTTVLIADASEKPLISSLAHTDNVNCTAPFNGTASIPAGAVSYQGSVIAAPYAAAGFSSLWSTTATAENISALGAGTYSLQITHINDNCISDPVSVNIVDDLTYPVVDANILNNQTSCNSSSPNGQAEATETSGAGTYSFDWYSGIGVGAAGTELSEIVEGRTTRVLPSGDYTVRATSTATSCESTVTIFLPDNIVNPSISFTGVTDVTRCDNPDGTATPILTDASIVPTPDFTISYVRTFSIPSDPASPPSDPAVIKATASADGTTHSSTAAIVNGVNPPVVTNLSPGYLTALVVDNNTSCESTPTTVQINDATALNKIDVVSINSAGFCGLGGGFINITATGGAGGYVYEWYEETPSNSNINFFNNPPVMPAGTFITNSEDLMEDNDPPPAGPVGVTAGTYTVIVRDAVGCGAYLIDNVPFAGAPVVTITPKDPERCTAPFDGSIEVSVVGTQNYSITFFDGNSITAPGLLGEISDDGIDNDGDGLVDAADPDSKGSEICGDGADNDGDGLMDALDSDCGPILLTLPAVDAGQYLVRVIDYTPANRPCPIDKGVTLIQQGFAPIVQIDQINPNTACDVANADGSVRITLSQDGVDNRDPATTPIAFEVTSVNPAPVNPPVFPQVLSSGIASITSDLNYGFAPAIYTVRVTENASGCFRDQSLTIPNQPVVPDISFAVTHETFCAPLSNGSAEVTAMNPVAISDYTFTWYSDPALTTILHQANGGAGGEFFNSANTGYTLGAAGQGAGNQTFYLRAKRLVGTGAGAGCNSPGVTVVIQDRHVTPVTTLTSSPNTSCDPLIGEGSISIATQTNTGGLMPAVENSLYTYSIDPVVAGPFANSNGALSTLFTNLTHNGGVPYTVTALNEESGCIISNAVTVLDTKFPIQLTNSLINDKLTCNPDGDITVTEIVIDRSLTSQPDQVFNTPPLGTDFDFRWFKGTPGTFTTGSPLTDNNPTIIDSELLMIGNGAGEYDDPAPDRGAGAYYVVARQISAAGRFGANCESTPLKVQIKDKSVNSVIKLTPFTNTSCDPVVFEGVIEVDVTDASVVPGVYSYTYGWTALTAGRTAPGTPANPYDGVDNLFSSVQNGDYRLSATNTVTGCITTAQTTVQLNTTPIFLQNVDADAQLFCTPSGSLEVTEINFNDRTGSTQNVTGAGLADFSFAWFRDGTAAADQIGGAAALLDSVAYTGIAADPDYYVVATRINNGPGRDCSSAPFKIAIPDQRYFPVVTFATARNTTCNSNYDGEITVTANTSGFASASNYSFDWTNDPGAPIVIADEPDSGSPYATTAADNVGPGVYEITVTNLTNLCATDASVTLLQNTTPVQIWDVTKIDQRDCTPFDGSITIDTNDPAHVSVLGPYTFVWDKAGVPLTPVPINTLSAVNAGAYSVTGTKTSGIGAGCVTAPFSVTLLDLTQRPAIELQSAANFACDPALANGQISSVIFEGSGAAPAADYTFQWFPGKNNTTGPSIGNSNVISNQAQGDYTLQVVDNVSPNRGCGNTATLAIDFDETSFSFAVDQNDQNLCSPLQNGNVSVTGITEVRNGTATSSSNFALFDFQWFDENEVAHASTPAFVNGANSISNLAAGQYYVQVRNALGCISTKTAGLVDDLTVLPLITLENFLNPAVCILPDTPGFLQVSADNSLNFSDYTFEWFEGGDTSGTLVEPNNATLGNVQYNQPLQYTVRVTNNATNCVNLDTYRFSVDTVAIDVIASAVSRTNCLSDNGSLFATTLTGSGSLYNYEWYAGPVATGTPVFTMKEVAGAPIGQYTVIAINPNHSFCISTPYTTRVTDGRVLPAVVATQKNPLTYCDPANPNGVAFATVNNQVTGFTFDWFAGSAGGSPIYTGSEVTRLTATTYVVRATDVLSGCENTASIVIDNNPVDVPEPKVVIVSHHTNCVVPDGVLSASVNGNTASYFLQWYNGNSVKSQNDETGEFNRDLNKGFYTTTATDNESGCVSDPVVTEILPFQENPEFDILTVPTNCEENVGEASYFPLNDVEIFSIEWDINDIIEFGSILSDLPKGEFTVTATSTKSCVVTKTFEILPEVLVFNGVSRNNDGQNDIFEIACIQDFPNNHVKIFNRAGTLVYEGKGYDNQDVYFDGVSNRGINLLGTDLPDGTYFYIIDKRNGAEPKTGYLELLKQ